MIITAQCSDRGGRDYNEDCVVIRMEKDCCCAIVADGLGGHGGGQQASRAAADFLAEKYFSIHGRKDQQWTEQVYGQANQIILDMQTNLCKMKTTCVSLFIEDGTACWAHLGDSRLYHFVDGEQVFMTADHSVSWMAVLSGEITKDQIRFHEDRNRVLRAFGANERVKPDTAFAEVDDGKFHAFLLCTDGFWEYVLEGEMEIDLAKTTDPAEWLLFMQERLKKKAAANNDNYTAAAVFIVPANENA